MEGAIDIDLVVNLKLREEALLAKCLGRRICSECGGNYNVACIDIKGDNESPGMYMAPLLPPPECASKLISRSDDKEEVVKERLRIYYEMVSLIISNAPTIFLSSPHSCTLPNKGNHFFVMVVSYDLIFDFLSFFIVKRMNFWSRLRMLVIDLVRSISSSDLKLLRINL